MTDPPSAIVGHAKRALKLLAANAVTRRDKKIDSIKPRLQRGPAVLENGAGARIEVVAACEQEYARRLSELVKR